MGCMAQSRGQELIDRLPDVDLVLGTQKFHRAADYLDEILAGRREKIVDVAEEQGSEATIREHLLYGNGARMAAKMATVTDRRYRSPRLSASCRAATSIARSASCLTRAARNAAAAFPTSWPSAASWCRKA